MNKDECDKEEFMLAHRRLKDTTPDEWDNYNRHDANVTPAKAIDVQIGGDHYKKFKLQPAEFCYINNIPYLESTAIKYLCRWRDKGGIQDLDKAIHFIQLLKEFERTNANT